MKARFLALAALVLGLASCQTEPEGLDVNVGGEVDTVVTVSLPETTRANSALGAFENVDWTKYTIRYQMKIYDANGRVSDAIYETYLDGNEGNSVTFPVRLVPGREYSFVAWADIVKDTDHSDLHYDTTNLMNITLKDTWVAMDETRDAYTDVETLTYYGNTPVNLQLIRPFAKLRVVTTDMVALNNLDIVPTKATVEYTVDHYNAFNALAGSVIGDSKNRDIKHEEFSIKSYGEDVLNGADMTLFTDYFFAKSEEEPISFILTVYDQNGVAVENIIKTNNFSTDIPVQRNYLTTIQGNVLTDSNNVKVTVVEDGKFAGEKVEEIVEVGNATDLQEAINESTENTTIVLGGDIVLGDGIITLAATRAEAPQYALLVPAGKVVNLDLNGKTISQEKACTDNYSMLVNKGTLTINGEGKISFKDTGEGDPNFGWGSYTLRNEGTLVVNGGTIEHLGEQNPGNGQPNVHMYCAIFQYSGKSTINGGVISTPTYRSARLWNGEMTINGGQFVGQLWLQAVSDNANLVINGGEFSARGNDGSSVFVSNSGKAVKCSINGGLFNNKVGMSEPLACITGGTFTSVAKEGTAIALLDSDYDFVADGDNWTVERKADVAKIGEVGYTSLQKAVAAVQDGETITLVANETFTEKNYYDNGGWKDGLGYAGDKSFTIDLNNNTVSQNGALNDYLLWFKNVGSKANTITIKNGTLDAGTTAFCALCTASSHDNPLTINLENITLINKISNGSTIKVRAGSTLNVNAGTKIIGKDSYLGIENWNATVNVYDGAEIYMNGTSSYNGCLIGVGGNGTVNVYGGYGKGVSGGLIAMTSGGTINVSGGEWIANTDGAYANSNKSVLIAQSDKQYNAGAGNAIVNVTGGTFKGGYNCYGNAVGDAQINIKGGNFNADPASYVVAGYKAVEANGVWTVVVDPAAKIGDTEYDTLSEAFNVGGNITLLRDVTVAETVVLAEGKTVVLDLNGKTLSAVDMNTIKNNGGNLTIKNGTVTRTGDVVGYSVNNASGEIAVENATIKRGLYTSGSKMTATNANISHEQSSRHAIYAWDCEVTINSGTFHNDNAGNATLMASGSSIVTINGGTFSIADGRSALGWTSSMIDQNSTAQVIVKGGLFNGGFRINSANTTLTIEGGEFNTNNGSAFTDYSGTKVVKGGKFTDAGAQNWAKKYIADGYEMNDNGEVVMK